MSKRARSTRVHASSSHNEIIEEKICKFGLFDNEDHQMNYNTLIGLSIHSGDVVDREFLSNKGLARYDPLHKGVKFRLEGIEREIHLLEFGWRESKDQACSSLPHNDHYGKEGNHHRVTEIDLFYLYCIFRDGIVCNIPYWLAKYLKSVREKSVIFRGMFVTMMARSFSLLTNELGECFWLATREVAGEGGGDDEEGDGEGGNEGIGVFVDNYRSMSQGEWQVHRAQWMVQQDERWGGLDTWMGKQDQRASWMYRPRSSHKILVDTRQPEHTTPELIRYLARKPTTLLMGIRDTCLPAAHTAPTLFKTTPLDPFCFILVLLSFLII
ncbi:hypothetical protein Tco_0610571 [Tanacetum coccineum]